MADPVVFQAQTDYKVRMEPATFIDALKNISEE